MSTSREEDIEKAAADIVSICQEFNSAIVSSDTCLACKGTLTTTVPILFHKPLKTAIAEYDTILLFSCVSCANASNKGKFLSALDLALREGNVRIMNEE